MTIEAALFDIGGVLVDWNPRLLYREFFPDDEAAMEWFLDEVCNQAWDDELDAGRSMAEATETLAAKYPDLREPILAYRSRWPEMLGPPIFGTVELVDELRRTGIPSYALSNWSAETFPVARDRYPFLGSLAGIVISGEIGIAKPDRRIFEHCFDRFGLRPATTLFIDNFAPNVAAAEALGMPAHLFRGPEGLRRVLQRLELIQPPA